MRGKESKREKGIKAEGQGQLQKSTSKHCAASPTKTARGPQSAENLSLADADWWKAREHQPDQLKRDHVCIRFESNHIICRSVERHHMSNGLPEQKCVT